jgi:hypothetical protein
VFSNAGTMTHVIALVMISKVADEIGVDVLGQALVDSAAGSQFEQPFAKELGSRRRWVQERAPPVASLSEA